MIQDLKTEIEQLAIPIFEQEGFELVEIKLSRFKKNFRLQVFVDSDHGVTLDECAKLSRLLGTALDTGDVIDSKYLLEVSSPGLDRPLHSERDFKRRIGENMTIEIVDQGQEKKITGTLTGVEDNILHLSGDEGEKKVSLSDVRVGKINF